MSVASCLKFAGLLLATCVLLVAVRAAAQSSKSAISQTQESYSGARQQPRARPAGSVPPAPASSARRRSDEQQQQQQQLDDQYDDSAASSGGRQQQQQQQQPSDPLADSEPALYGSVAGAPGVDFPAFTRIPKTSFTCDNKQFDFGFYADEEAGCQVYHVCWSGRRESFLCGIGTVFNQAILACDYWHSVDCSKSSQFYGVNSELGKSSAEPAASSRPAARRQEARLPAGSQQTRVQRPFDEQQKESEPQSDSFEQQQQQSTYTGRKQQQQQQQQQQQLPKSRGAKRPAVQQQQQIQVQPVSSTTYAPPPASPRSRVERPRISMDYSQKISSLIESPIRAPLAAVKRQQQQPATSKRPAAAAANFAQLAVARAQQNGSQKLNGRKSAPSSRQPQQSYGAPISQQQQQQSDFDSDQQQQQQLQANAFDDSPVQTTTTTSGPIKRQQPASSFASDFQQTTELPVSPQLNQQTNIPTNPVDGSSAVVDQYDTISQPQPQPQQQQQQQLATGNTNDDTPTPLYDSTAISNSDDDFRSAGARAAASHNQNWYIMRAI